MTDVKLTDQKQDQKQELDYVFTPETYDKNMTVNFTQDKLMTARELLMNIIHDIGSDVKMLNITKTYNAPFNHTFNPSIQMAESIVVVDGKRKNDIYEFKLDYDLPNIGFWDFVLDVEGEFNDTHLSNIFIQGNGITFDEYRRVLYSKVRSIPGHENRKQIPLDFWTKDINRILFIPFFTQFYLFVSNVPENVKIRLIMKKLAIDHEVADIYNKEPRLQLINTHHEKLITEDDYVSFPKNKTRICMLRYGFMTKNGEKIYDVLESIDGVPMSILCGTQKLSLNDSVIWFELPSPIVLNMMLVRFKRKSTSPVIFVYECNNFLMYSDKCVIPRYSSNA